MNLDRNELLKKLKCLFRNKSSYLDENSAGVPTAEESKSNDKGHSLRSGFFDQYHFSRVFKDIMRVFRKGKGGVNERGMLRMETHFANLTA